MDKAATLQVDKEENDQLTVKNKSKEKALKGSTAQEHIIKNKSDKMPSNFCGSAHKVKNQTTFFFFV